MKKENFDSQGVSLLERTKAQIIAAELSRFENEFLPKLRLIYESENNKEKINELKTISEQILDFEFLNTRYYDSTSLDKALGQEEGGQLRAVIAGIILFFQTISRVREYTTDIQNFLGEIINNHWQKYNQLMRKLLAQSICGFESGLFNSHALPATDVSRRTADAPGTVVRVPVFSQPTNDIDYRKLKF